MASRKRLIVGIDFGTTKTCVAYANPGAEGAIELVRGWPMQLPTTPMVPSRIGYNRGVPAGYGDGVLPGAESMPTRAMREMLASGILHIPAALNPFYVTSDFLRHIFAHISDHIPEIEQQDTHVAYYFTVPATWSQETRDALRSAANGAQFGSAVQRESICILAEPEAATLSVLAQCQNALKPGDGLLVCDCGGGTVDVTTCSILSVNPTLHFQQITSSTGGMCGSTAFDFRFYQLLARELGDAFLDLPREKTRPGSAFMNEFERVKKTFHEKERRTSFISLTIKRREGAVCSDIYDTHQSQVVLTPRRMKELFDPVIDRIRFLVLSQIHEAHKCSRPINKVVLVGGFSASPYLRSRLENWLRENEGSLAIPQDEPYLAVVRGAVLYGLHFADGPTWHCTRTYGVAVANMPVFEPLWVLKKGESYSASMPHHGSITIAHTHDKSLVYEIGIYECSLVHPQHHIESDYQIARKAVIVCDFNERRNRSAYPYLVVAGQTAYTLHADVEVTFTPADRSLHFVVRSQGQEVGRGQVALPVE